MIADGIIGLLIGFMLGSLSGVFCFALIVGAGRYEDGEYLEDEDEESNNNLH
jgi:hypothetical protein